MKTLLILVILFSSSVCYAFGPSNKLCWDNPNDPKITGYKVYIDTITNSTKVGIDIGNKPVAEGTQLCIMLSNVPVTVEGTLFARVTAYNAGAESGKSNEISFPFSLSIPDVIKNLLVR